jgi:Tol biopolymer transport system component
MKKLPVLLFSALIICLLPPLQAQNDEAQRLYQEGIFQMEAMGNFVAAIERFEKLVSAHPGNKPLASRALLMAGRCHEMLGQEEAEKVYNRILEEYGDQREIVSEARARLMALTDLARLAMHTDMLTRRVWQGPDACSTGQLSPDEKFIAFTDWSTGDLALRDLATGESRPLTNNWTKTESGEYALFPVFAPDGNSIAYAWCSGSACGLRMINLKSGEVQILLEGNGFNYLQVLGWSPDGRFFALRVDNHEEILFCLYSVEDDTLTILKSFDEDFSPTNVAFSPDGKFIAYDHHSGRTKDWLNIYTIDIENKEQFGVVTHPSENIVCGWTPDGTNLVFISDRTGINAIWTVAVTDGKNSEEPEMLKTDIGQAITPIRLTAHGSFYYVLYSGDRDVYTASFNPEETEPFGPPEKKSFQYQGSNRTPVWSNDGRYIACEAARSQKHIYYSNAVVIHDTETGQERNIILDVKMIFGFIRWSPDDQSIAIGTVYLKDRHQHHALFILNVATGEVTDTIDGGRSGFFTESAWSRDAKYKYFFRGNYLDLRYVLVKRDMETGEETELLEPFKNMAGSGRKYPTVRLVYSSDDEMLAFSWSSEIEKRSALFLLDLKEDDPKPRTLFTINHPEVIKRTFSFEEDKVLFIQGKLDENNTRRDLELWSIHISSGERQKIVAIPEGFISFSLHPDGKTALFNMGTQRHQCEIWAIDNLLPRSQ